jgi:hypothetical protein
MTDESQHRAPTFTWRNALLGLISYLVVTFIVAIVFFR